MQEVHGMGFFRSGTWIGSWCHEGWNMFTTPGGIFMGLIFLAIVGVIIYLLVSRNRDRQEFTRYHAHQRTLHGQNMTGDAMEMLRTRYAKGEITDEEYDRMKNKLG